MREFEKYGCFFEFFYILNPFVEILSAYLVLMLVEADYSYYRLDLVLSQIGHVEMYEIKKNFLTFLSTPESFIPQSYILYLVACKMCKEMF
jgi:hypothetical protein